MRASPFALFFTLLLAFAARGEEDFIADCRALLLRGRYAEAIDAAKALEDTHPIDAKLLRAEALADSGRWDEAIQLVVPLFESETKNVAVARMLALVSDRYRQHYDGWT